ncbi:MAG TPA: alpha/beta fold hydrolase [Candidatus Dormibacteraeota bacterium]|nr:alpha/beta fold hydrolase [Candidatus Dormibacteraeota bacterium]
MRETAAETAPRGPRTRPLLVPVATAVGAALATVRGARGYRRWASQAAMVRRTYGYEEPQAAGPVPGAPLAARVLGPRGGGAVILLHGLAASSRVWGARFDGLARDRLLVVPDLLGFGSSPRPPTAYSLADHADAVAATVRAAAGPGRASPPPVVAAHSFGACVALALARRHPDLVRGIVAISPPVFRDAAHARAQMLGALTLVERTIAMDTPWARMLCTAVCMHRPRLARRLARAYRPELPPAVAIDGVAHTWPSYSESLAELLSATARPEWAIEAGIPLRVLTGGADRLPDAGYLRELAARSPLVSVEVAEGADHMVVLSHAARIVELVEAIEVEVGAAQRAP